MVKGMVSEGALGGHDRRVWIAFRVGWRVELPSFTRVLDNPFVNVVGVVVIGRLTPRR